MGKSLTETAKAILMKESNDPTPDRDAKKSNPNMATLRPNSKGAEGRFATPGSTPPNSNDVEDLGPALVNNTDIPPSAKASKSVGKDTSGSSQSRKGAVPAEKPKQQAEVMEEDSEVQGETIEEETDDIQISEELEAFITKMLEEGYTEEQIAEAIEQNFELVSEEAETEEYQVDMSEAIEALFAGEELSEEFKEKAKTIFEAAVKAKIQEEIAVLEETYAEVLEEQVQKIQEDLSTNIDDYLNYVVEQWTTDNEVAIESGLRSELTEEFISGLRNLFAEHYIDIPEDKISIVEEMGSKVEELEAKLNEEIERNVSLSKMINESTKNEIILNACDGLTSTEAQKLKSLAENLEFNSAGEYAKKVDVLKEHYFNSTVSNNNVLDNDTVEENGMISEQTSPRMSAYVNALGRKLPN